MKVIAIKTHKITAADHDLLKILDQYVKDFKDNSILVIASKIVAITQGKLQKMTDEEKEEFIKKSSQLYIPKEEHNYNLFITITNNILTYSAGIDESNVESGYIVLWPDQPSEVANKIRAYLKKRFKVKNAGVIITDMAAIPLQWGIIAGPIAYSGFNPLKILTGTPDVFGKPFKYTKVGIWNGLAAAGGVVMGEGNEQTPLAIIEDIPFVEFQDRNPSDEELKSLVIQPKNDLFGPLMKYAPWEKGGKS